MASKKPTLDEVRRRLVTDFQFYALNCLTVRTKGSGLQRMRLTQSQRYIHQQIEKQKAETGRVRALIVKGRQVMATTYVAARHFHRITNSKGLRAFILTHDMDTTQNVFEMVERYYENLPELVKPSTTAANAKELYFGRIGSGYKVGTAGNKATGRGQTLQLFHGSEVAYWPSAEEHVKGSLQAVPNMDGTEVILESTSAGPSGMFYEACQRSLAGEGEFRVIFVPWFWMDEYREQPMEGFRRTDEEEELVRLYSLSDPQLMWRRNKMVELRDQTGFRREYPNTVDEAFMADARGALWTRDLIEQTRVHPDRMPELVRSVIAVDPAVSHSENSAETGIVGAGVDDRGHVYVFADRSGKFAPSEWAQRAIDLYHGHDASYIVAEINQGGLLVENTIRPMDRTVAYKGIHASKGKRIRAEPVAALYERGMVHHVGSFMGLENQMCTWDASTSSDSPDRVDALVHAITELALGRTRNVGFFPITETEPTKKPEPDDPDHLVPNRIMDELLGGDDGWTSF